MCLDYNPLYNWTNPDGCEYEFQTNETACTADRPGVYDFSNCVWDAGEGHCKGAERAPTL